MVTMIVAITQARTDISGGKGINPIIKTKEAASTRGMATRVWRQWVQVRKNLRRNTGPIQVTNDMFHLPPIKRRAVEPRSNQRRFQLNTDFFPIIFISFIKNKFLSPFFGRQHTPTDANKAGDKGRRYYASHKLKKTVDSTGDINAVPF